MTTREIIFFILGTLAGISMTLFFEAVWDLGERNDRDE